ncbi:hypothetical protein HPB51_002055 [Rhipicephalus microplus]|uniref:Uncharacterized protein n=1 Tax=Rhipicephalus microplus TaxID=6941 RepID=A0A9J6DRQ7_RHIMP|nr:hypothetical protein HPB51_002055 [Rhipicephalus microplus]
MSLLVLLRKLRRPSTSTIPIVAEEGSELHGGKAEVRWCRQGSWDVTDVGTDIDMRWDVATQLCRTKAENRSHVEELLESQEQYQEEVKFKNEELLLLKHEVDQYADTLGSQSFEYAQELENIERKLNVRHAAEMEALKSEHRANIEVLRESLQQELLDVQAGYKEEQRKLRRSLETEHNFVANSPKAQVRVELEALKNTYKAQIEKMKEQYARVVEQLAKERAQLEQHMTWRRRLPSKLWKANWRLTTQRL